MSRRKLRYAIHGIVLGLSPALVLIPGLLIIARVSYGRHVGHRLLFGFASGVALFVLTIFWFGRKYYRSKTKAPQSIRSAPDSRSSSAGLKRGA